MNDIRTVILNQIMHAADCAQDRKRVQCLSVGLERQQTAAERRDPRCVIAHAAGHRDIEAVGERRAGHGLEMRAEEPILCHDEEKPWLSCCCRTAPGVFVHAAAISASVGGLAPLRVQVMPAARLA